MLLIKGWNKMRKIVNMIRWVGVAIFALMALSSLAQGGFLGALLFVLGGAIIAPLNVISKIRGKLKLNKVFSIILAIVLLFVGALARPTSDVQTNNNSNTQISDSSSNNENSKTESSISTDKKTETSKPITTTCAHSNTVVKNELKATCVENGYTGDRYCVSCNKVLENGSQVKATGHDTEVRNKKEASTYAEGYTGDTYCKICDTMISSGKSIPKIANSTQQQNTSQTVYITETGKKYHSRSSCSGLSRAKAIYTSTLQNAKNRGLGPCSKCY